MTKIAESVLKLKAKQQKRARRKGDLAPNPEFWEILNKGALLTTILEDFYAQVFADPKLSPFFADSTQQRAVEKQYLFMKRILTGENCYFGERPRNAHHWMVISNELFDYREALMEITLRKHGIPEKYVQFWRAIDEVFRKQIVKDKPINKIIGGIEIPAEGYKVDTLTVGSVCDECHNELPVGMEVTYHTRTGKTYCTSCTAILVNE